MKKILLLCIGVVSIVLMALFANAGTLQNAYSWFGNDVERQIFQFGRNQVFSAPVLAINAGGAATVKTTNAINFNIGAKFYSKTALAAQALTSIASSTIPQGYTGVIGLFVDSGGTISMAMGTQVPNISASSTYVSANTFTVAGNLKTTFAPGTYLVASMGANGNRSVAVQSATYNGTLTTVTLNESLLTSNLTAVAAAAPLPTWNPLAVCCFGAIKVVNNSLSTGFVPGTTVLDVGTISTTYVDLSGVLPYEMI
jgi:hypothetical protein